jgi:hypothetical protein
MLLRRFAGSDGKLYFFNKRLRAKGVLKSSPKDLFVQRDLYSFLNSDGSRDMALEKYYAEIEGRANQIIEKIISSSKAGRVPQLSRTEKFEWDNYVYRQWTRVPDLQIETLANFDECLAESITEFETKYRPLTEAERISLQNPETIARLKQNSRVQALGSPPGLAVQALNQRGLVIAEIKRPKESFVVGSFPVAKLTYPGRTHLLDPTVEVWLPISSNIAVCSAGSTRDEKLVQLTDSRVIHAVNKAIYKQSSVIAGVSQKLIASLAKVRT